VYRSRGEVVGTWQGKTLTGSAVFAVWCLRSHALQPKKVPMSHRVRLVLMALIMVLSVWPRTVSAQPQCSADGSGPCMSANKVGARTPIATE
jgi:hypothetical protein